MRACVSDIVNNVLQHPRKITLAVDDNSHDKLHRMALFKAKATTAYIGDHHVSSATLHQRHHPVAGTSLFLAPGALSGLMRPLEAVGGAAVGGGAGGKRSMLRAEWIRESRRPSTAQLKRQPVKSGRLKIARFAGADQLALIRQTASLSSDDGSSATNAGWGRVREVE